MHHARTSHPPVTLEILTANIREDRALQRLNDLAKDSAGLFLVVLVRVNRHTVELWPAAGGSELPRFCQVFRDTESGKEQCLACRALVAFGACCRGLNEYVCHGGVSVIAAPAVYRDGTHSRHIVVASCAFANGPHPETWPQVHHVSQKLGTDMTALQRAYSELPAVSEEKRWTAKTITEIAALILGDLETRLGMQSGTDAGIGITGNGSGALWPAFEWAKTAMVESAGVSTGSRLIDLVIAMIRRDPGMPYSVAEIARAAQVTPNHLSARFRQHTGKTFQTFLNEERIAHACTLLQDPTIGIAQVARRAGFADPAYFSRRFRNATGHSPKSWREQHH